jgi:hypothetical protein
VYLHFVFDLWVEAWRKKVAQGDVIVVRYADDLVVGFESRAEAERYLEEFRERLAKFGLELHPEKTRLIEFGRFAAPKPREAGRGKAGDLHVSGLHALLWEAPEGWAFIVWRETAKKRLVAKLQAVKAELTRRRHEPIASIGAWLQKVTSGYYQYHAVPGNLPRLHLFRCRLSWVWCRALSRRSQRSYISWSRLNRLAERWIPVPSVLHPYPIQRFDATHPRREPYA